MTGLAIAAVCLLTLIWMTLSAGVGYVKDIRDTRDAETVQWNLTDPRKDAL